MDGQEEQSHWQQPDMLPDKHTQATEEQKLEIQSSFLIIVEVILYIILVKRPLLKRRYESGIAFTFRIR